MEKIKSPLQSRTLVFFSAVLATGGLDLIESLVQQTTITWREIALTVIGLVGIALRLDTSSAVKFGAQNINKLDE